MRTAVMTDTNSGITLTEGSSNGIYVLPMPVVIDGKDYFFYNNGIMATDTWIDGYYVGPDGVWIPDAAA